ncbi:hypothetical protein HPB52_006099 [Rhipicephalus sanguineus]|uniref:Uncharacterized protein n=1 Tax=Rhipicephalus sanguineus TaxID=34632 RepID=A0A9D4PZM5_RHISA|nr:hypothetical protein HPB52_006099 [Rhipicephalus sanguineus]
MLAGAAWAGPAFPTKCTATEDLCLGLVYHGRQRVPVWSSRILAHYRAGRRSRPTGAGPSFRRTPGSSVTASPRGRRAFRPASTLKPRRFCETFFVCKRPEPTNNITILASLPGYGLATPEPVDARGTPDPGTSLQWPYTWSGTWVPPMQLRLAFSRSPPRERCSSSPSSRDQTAHTRNRSRTSNILNSYHTLFSILRQLNGSNNQTDARAALSSLQKVLTVGIIHSSASGSTERTVGLLGSCLVSLSSQTAQTPGSAPSSLPS